MIIKQLEFVKSSSKMSECPPETVPEYAFVGRSNVGKSSLINTITLNKYLAKTSGTPGKTRLINHFMVNQEWYLTDLPGYGYARVSKVQKQEFSKIIIDYILKRKSLVVLFVLIDCRHSPQRIDVEFMDWLIENQISFSIVFTKTDKLEPKALERNLDSYKNFLLEKWEELPSIFITSSQKKLGREALLAYINDTNKMLYSEGIFKVSNLE